MNKQTQPTVDWSRLAPLLEGKNRIALTTHVRPDGDALGSQLGMAGALEQLGKEVVCINDSDVPRRLAFLVDGSRWSHLSRCSVTLEQIDTFDLLIILDTSAWAQLGEMADIIRHTRIATAVIDHHVSGDDLEGEVFTDPTAEATGRLVVEATDALGVELNERMAEPLFTALATDTGWFRFSSTTTATYELAARLVRSGAQPDRIYHALHENQTHGRVQLTCRGVGRAQVDPDGRLVHTWIDRADFETTGAESSDSEDVINALLAIAGTEVAVLFVELPDGSCKTSFRSRCHVDCCKIAEQFGGGGHRKAAGATIARPLTRVRAEALDAVRLAMR